MEFVDYQLVSGFCGVVCAALFWAAIFANL